MSDLCSITLTGRLTKDAVFEQLPNSQSFSARFGVANNFYDFSTRGEASQFFEVRLVMGPGRVDKAREFLAKGRLVGIPGQLRTKTGADGRTWLNVDASDFVLVGPPPSAYSDGSRDPAGKYAPQAQPQAQPQYAPQAPPAQAPPQYAPQAPPAQAPPQYPPQAPPQAAPPGPAAAPPWAAPQ